MTTDTSHGIVRSNSFRVAIERCRDRFFCERCPDSCQIYNLDVIISVGYRVKSQQGTRFRQWATRILREHLTRGYTLHRQRFEANARELEAAMQLVKKAAQSPELLTDTGRELVDIVTRYAQTFLLLQRYDEGLLTEPPAQAGGRLPKLSEARIALAGLPI